MTTRMRRMYGPALLGVLALGGSAGVVFAQESKSAPIARQLTELMDRAKLDSIAAVDSATPGQFVGALYFPGSELLVVSARYSVPALMQEKLSKRNYKDVYIDLNSASVPESKIFIEDLLADGLHSKPDGNQPFDVYESGVLRIALDGDWKKQKMTEESYLKSFATADEKYSRMLSALVAELKKAS